MPNRYYNVGDTVKLESTSVNMTVIGRTPDGEMVTCQWVDVDNIIHQGVFPADALTFVP